jgi:hypothetical protein
MVDVVTFAFWIVSPVYPLATNDPFGFSALIAITATPSLPTCLGPGHRRWIHESCRIKTSVYKH